MGTDRTAANAPWKPDPAVLASFEAGTLDREHEAALAREVARLLPHHWRLPHPMAADLTRLIRHLGGERQLLDWLGQHAGAPRITARIYELVDLLDQVSADQAVVAALAELRARSPDPPELTGIIPPDTDIGTLASIATEIELLLGDEQTGKAVQTGLAAADLLERLAPRAAELGPQAGNLAELARRARQRLAEASAG
ncbi:MAG: hypothetical protein JWO79_1834 [Actinomycetia bacterium]|nr:hypothetical protein [Actinomycetes bacterium]